MFAGRSLSGIPATKAKDMMMNSRVLFPVTLMAAVWFCSFRSMAQAQQRPGAAGAEGTRPSDLYSLQQKAQAGDAKAEYLLGWSYMTAAGVSQDYEQEATWYRKAAAGGSAGGKFGLGYLSKNGKGVRRDYRQAVTHYTAAAQRGHSTAQNNLGSMYAHGLGVRRNLVEAVRWYRAAGDHGEVTSQCNLAFLYFRGRRAA